MSKSTIRNIYISIILILTSISTFGFMMYQVIQKGRQLEVQINALEQEQKQQNSHINLKRITENTVTEREKVQSYFLSQESDSIDFLNQIEDIAPRAGVDLKTSGLETVMDTENSTKWIQAEFSFSGSRERVQQFIKILETFPLVSRIMFVDMIAMSSTKWQAEVTMQVQVLEYDK